MAKGRKVLILLQAPLIHTYIQNSIFGLFEKTLNLENQHKHNYSYMNKRVCQD